MSALSRRAMLELGAFSLAGAVAPAAVWPSSGSGWIEVTGSALVAGRGDHDAARRRAVADALLSAALAGGAEVRGHSVMSGTRLTSDLLVVRPLGRVLAHEIVSATIDAGMWRVRIRARVGVPDPGACPDRRRLVITAYPPRVSVSLQAPGWAEALATGLAQGLIEDAARHPAVAELGRADRLPPADPARDRADYRVLTRGGTRPPPGGHGLHLDLRIAPAGRMLGLSLRLRLEGPGGEVIEETHDAQIAPPGASILGRAAPLAAPDRATLAQRLTAGARPALDAMLGRAGCTAVQARIDFAQGRLTVAAGRVHGLSGTSLAFTSEPDRTIEMFEIAHLEDRAAVLAPLDPTRPPAAFEGRSVRFLDAAAGLP